MKPDANDSGEPTGTCPTATDPFPAACAEVPVAHLESALAYYQQRLGFTIDWAEAGLGLAGISRGATRLFVSDAAFRAERRNQAPIVLWFNASNRGEVDAIHAQWHAAGAHIDSPPQAMPYKLYECFARDLDDNVLRVFYDFGWEER